MEKSAIRGGRGGGLGWVQRLTAKVMKNFHFLFLIPSLSTPCTQCKKCQNTSTTKNEQRTFMAMMMMMMRAALSIEVNPVVRERSAGDSILL